MDDKAYSAIVNVDIDGVLRNNTKAIVEVLKNKAPETYNCYCRSYEEKYGTDSIYPLMNGFLDRDIYRKYIVDMYPRLYTELCEPMKNAYHFFCGLQHKGVYIVLNTRQYGILAQLTIEWVERNFRKEYNAVFLSHDKPKAVFKGNNDKPVFLVDDDMENFSVDDDYTGVFVRNRGDHATVSEKADFQVCGPDFKKINDYIHSHLKAFNCI